MAASITVAGSDRTSQAHFQSLTVTNSVASKADTADLVFTTTGNWRPKAGNVVVVSDGTSTQFGGVILEIEEQQIGPSQFRYVCNCRDYVYLLDRLLVTTTYVTQAGSAIVRDLVTSNTSGFTSSGVQNSGNVAAQVFDYMPVSDCIQTLANQLEWNWGVSYDRDIMFFSALTQPAPVGTINVDSDTTTYSDLVLHESARDLKNSLFVKEFSRKSTNTFTETFKADGSQKVFPLQYEPGSTAAADIAVTRTPIGGSTAITQTLNLDVVDGQADSPIGGANDVFINYDSPAVRYDVVPASSDTIIATYTIMQEIPLNAQDKVSQSTMAAREGGDGVHEFVINDPGLKANDGTDTLAQARASSFLARYGMPRFSASFNSFIQGWKAGQVVQLTSTKRFGGFSKTMYVQQVKKRLVNHPSGGSPLLAFEIELSDQSLPI